MHPLEIGGHLAVFLHRIMPTLAINTATRTQSVALLNNNKIINEISWHTANNESEVLLPNIQKLLKKAKRNFSDIDKIITVCGPGLFSGLRIGVTVSNTLAFALNAPLLEIGTEAFPLSISEDLKENDIRDFGESILKMPLSKFRKVKVAIPKYSRPPHITKPKNVP